MISKIRYTEESWRKSFAPSMSPSPGAAELSAKKGLLARDPCASAQLPQLCGPLPKGPRVPRHAVRLGVGRTAARAPGGCQRDTDPTNHVVDPSGNLPTSCWGRVTCRFPQMNHRNPQCSCTSSQAPNSLHHCCLQEPEAEQGRHHPLHDADSQLAAEEKPLQVGQSFISPRVPAQALPPCSGQA